MTTSSSQNVVSRWRSRELGFHPQVWALGVGFAIVLAIAVVAAWMARRSEAEAKWVNHSLEIISKLSELTALITRGEAGQRGYLLTGNSEYLGVYRAAINQIPTTLAEIKAATRDNPMRQAGLAAVDPSISGKLAQMAETIRLYQTGDPAGALALVQSGKGFDLMERIKSQIDRMDADEKRLFQLRSTEFERTGQLLLFSMLLGGPGLLGVAMLAIVLIGRSYRELEKVNDSLEIRVAARTADLRESNDEIQRFAYIVGHDLRAPLVNIMGFTSELSALTDQLFERLSSRRAPSPEEQTEDGTLNGDFKEALGFIRAGIGKMDRLINAILKISREGRRELRPEHVDMSALLNGITESLAHQVESAKATVEIGQVPAAVSDRLALEQVFTNLVDNALKYLRPDHPGLIELRGRSTKYGLVYEVRDNGRGIDPRDRDRVFELFRRAGAQDRPGEGIGLAHVRTMVRRLGGTIVLSSTPGSGSIFTVTLPNTFIDEQARTIV